MADVGGRYGTPELIAESVESADIAGPSLLVTEAYVAEGRNHCSTEPIVVAHVVQGYVVQRHNHCSMEALAAPYMVGSHDTRHAEGLAVALAGTSEAGGTGVNDLWGSTGSDADPSQSCFRASRVLLAASLASLAPAGASCSFSYSSRF